MTSHGCSFLPDSFDLPYRLHYSREQFSSAYPRARKLLDVKRKYDPDAVFSSWFYKHISGEDGGL